MSPAKTVAVASIHEEDFSLDDLSVEELEKLRDKCEVVLAQKLEKEVPLLSFDFEPPDDRSYGRLQFEAKTLYGVLKFDGNIDSSGEIADAKPVLLYPDPRTDTRELNSGPEEVEFDGIHEHLTLDTSEDEAKVAVVKAVLGWQKFYSECLDRG
jgi:hypothetical protein